MSVVRTLEDTVFYARSPLSTFLVSQRTVAVHDGLYLDRFATMVVHWTLPFRMPRHARR